MINVLSIIKSLLMRVCVCARARARETSRVRNESYRTLRTQNHLLFAAN